MARLSNNPDPVAAQKDRAAMKALRVALQVRMPVFASFAGLSTDNVRDRENGKSPWRRDEIKRAVTAADKHLANACYVLNAVTSEQMTP